MDDLVTWLREQVDEYERVATSATSGPWHWVDPGGKVKSALVAGDWQPGWRGWEMVLPAAGGDMYPSKDDADFIALNDPGRALREVAALRLILDECAHTLEFEDYGHTVAEFVLKALGLLFADRPGYREEWRP